MTIVIGYVPSQVGEAALEAGLAEAAVRGDDVVILNSPRRRSTVDGELIDAAAADELVARAAALGVSARVDQSDHGDDIVETFAEVAACRKSGILIHTFMLARDPYLLAFVNRVSEIARGKAYFTSTMTLGQYIMRDFLRRKTRRAG